MDNAQRRALARNSVVRVVHRLVKATLLAGRDDRGFKLARVVLRLDPVKQVNWSQFCVARQVRERRFGARNIRITHLALEHAQELVFLHWSLQIGHHFV